MLTRDYVKDQIWNTLSEEDDSMKNHRIVKSLEYPVGSSDACYYLRIFIDGDTCSVSLGRTPGNAYEPQHNEMFINVGIESDRIDYPDEYDFSSLDEYDQVCEIIVLEESLNHIENNIEYWVDEVFNFLDNE